MNTLTFDVEGVEAVPLAATPQLAFKLRIDAGMEDTPIAAILLRVQVRIQPTCRGYQALGEAPGLIEFFGEPARWGATMRSMLWTHASAIVPAFTGATTYELPIECTFDFNVAATKYFAALDGGDIPLCFLFSGTCFCPSDRGLQASQISWEQESDFRLPVATWRQMIAHYYPNSTWLQLDRRAFDRLHHFKSRYALPTWDRAVEKLLELAEREIAIEAQS